MIVEGKSALDAISVKEKRRGPYGFLVNRQRPQSEANVKMKSTRKKLLELLFSEYEILSNVPVKTQYLSQATMQFYKLANAGRMTKKFFVLNMKFYGFLRANESAR